MGTITDSDANTLANVSITEHINSSENRTLSDTQSDILGNYSIPLEKDKETILIFTKKGYTSLIYNLPKLQRDTILDVQLSRVSKELELPEIVIEEKPITTTTENITYIVAQRPSNPTISGGVEGLLVTMGGVSSSNELSTQYNVRGGNFDENMVYVNGIEIHKPLLIRNAQQEGLSFVNPSMVKTLDFSTGGFTAEYGDKISSILDVGYKRPTRSFESSATASFLGGDLYLGSSSKKFSQVTGIRYKTTRSLLKTTDTEAEYKPDFINAQTYMAYNFTPDWEISFLGNYTHDTYKFIPQTRETKFGTIQNIRNFKAYFNGQEKDRFITHQGALSIKGNVSENVNLTLSGSIFGSNEYERYDINSAYVLREKVVEGENITEDPNSLIGLGSYREYARNQLESNIYNLSHRGEAKLGKHQLCWGLIFQREKIDEKINEWEMRDSIGYSQPKDDELLKVYYNLRSKNAINSNRYSAYLQDTYRLASNAGLFIVNLGLRASHWDYNKETIISPRGMIAFIPSKNENLVFRLSSGLYYQSPFYKELQQIETIDGNSSVKLNKDIKSQKSLHFILGNDVHFKSADRRFKLTTELYYKKLSDLIPYTVNNVKIRYIGENSSKGYIAGMDMKFYGEFVPGVDSWISLSLMKTEQEINGKKVPLPTDQSYNISIFFQDYFPGYKRLVMSLKGVFSQGLPFSPTYSSFDKGYFRNTPYKRVDIGFAWQVLGEDFAIRNKNSFWRTFKDIWLGIDCFNLFDMQNTSTYYWISDAFGTQYAVPNYLTGRQISAKLIVNF